VTVRTDWTLAEVKELFALPFMDLVFRAQTVHRRFQAPNTVQISTLLSIKTGACPEDCAYCPQSVRFDTGLETQELLELEEVAARARAAKDSGATRFCMGAAYRSPKPKDLRKVIAMIRAVKSLGMETCATLGMLDPEQARELKAAGLDYYNHNLDTSPQYYKRIISTRTYQDRLDTLEAVRDAGMNVCCGGIVGMGEEPQDRAELLHILATLPAHPQSVPINQLVRVTGTPLENAAALDPFDFVRTVAVARILMPRCHVRLSAGRAEMSDELQALCFLAGANSIFYGEKLLTTGNPDTEHDQTLFRRLNIAAERAAQPATGAPAAAPVAEHSTVAPAAEHAATALTRPANRRRTAVCRKAQRPMCSIPIGCGAPSIAPPEPLTPQPSCLPTCATVSWHGWT
jgi:biotin synthase